MELSVVCLLLTRAKSLSNGSDVGGRDNGELLSKWHPWFSSWELGRQGQQLNVYLVCFSFCKTFYPISCGKMIWASVFRSIAPHEWCLGEREPSLLVHSHLELSFRNREQGAGKNMLTSCSSQNDNPPNQSRGKRSLVFLTSTTRVEFPYHWVGVGRNRVGLGSKTIDSWFY